MITIYLSLITPEKIFYSGEAQMVEAPGVEGDFGVLPGHAPFVSLLRPGVITVEKRDGSVLRVAIPDGLAEVNPERCIILVEGAKKLDDWTKAEAEQQLLETKTEMESAETDVAKAALAKRMLMLEAVQLALN